MKKFIFYILSFLLILLTLFNFVQPPLLYGDVILNRLSDPLPPRQLYYSHLSEERVRAYSVSDNNLHAISTNYISLIEDFIPKVTYDFYERILEQEGVNISTRPHHFYEDDNVIIISFSGSLTEIYIIEKSNNRVYPLTFSPLSNLGNMYVSHIQKVDDFLILLGGEANSFNALIYTIHLPSFSIVDAIRFSTHPSAIEGSDYTLTSSGEAVFINGDSLKVYNPFTATYKLVPLDYITSSVIRCDGGFIAFGQTNESLYYTYFDMTSTAISTGKLSLPNSNLNLIDYLLVDNLLYVISFDPYGLRYSNYFTIYDLSTNNMIYNLGLFALNHYALLGIH